MNKVMILTVLVVVVSIGTAFAGMDSSIFTDKIQTTIRTESWENQITKNLVYGWYGKVNVSREGNTNFLGEAQADFLPIKFGSVKLGIEANTQVTIFGKADVLGRGYLTAKAGPLLFRYSPIQTDGNHKISVCWFWKKEKFSTFGYYDRELNGERKPLNITEAYVGYSITKKVMFMIGTKPIWTDGQNPNLHVGGGIKINL